MKAILVIDMPTKCYECPYASEKFCHLDMKKYPQGRKRKDCPLRPFLLGEELRKFRNAIKDENTLIGFNMAIAICNKHLGEKE